VRARPIAILAAFTLAACGSSGGDRARTSPASGSALGDTRELAATFAFPTERRVRTTLAEAGVVDPAPEGLVTAPSGTRRVEVVFRWRDHGRDPLPWDDLRLSAVTDGGARVRELYRTPAQRKRFGTLGAAREARVGFAVPGRARLRRVDLTSIIAGDPLRASWRVG
jgi:hypothetical protein